MIDTKRGEGIEVSSKFLEKDMAKFEREILKTVLIFASSVCISKMD